MAAPLPRTLGTIVAALSVFCIPAALASPQRVYVKLPPVSARQMDSDRDTCIQKALAFANGPGKVPRRTIGSFTGDTLANAFDMRGPKAAVNFEIRCMNDLGYVVLPITPEEDKALGHTRGATGRDEWYDAFVASDLDSRIAAAQVPTK